ncbi:hypothetical protein BDW66DRAFT_154552 [Aspergillus desertorum]
MFQGPVNSLQGVGSPSMLDPIVHNDAGPYENSPGSISPPQDITPEDITPDLTSALLDIQLSDELLTVSERMDLENLLALASLPAPLEDRETEISRHYSSRFAGSTHALTLKPILPGGPRCNPQTLPLRRSQEQSPWDTVCAEMLLIASQGDVREHWRGFVRSRLQEVLRNVGIATVFRASEILDKVWARSELRAAMGGSMTGEFVQWIDVMVEEKLETVLG